MQFHEGIPESDHLKPWFPKSELLVLDDLMAEGGENKALLDFFIKHSHHQILPCCTYAKTYFHHAILGKGRRESLVIV